MRAVKPCHRPAAMAVGMAARNMSGLERKWTATANQSDGEMEPAGLLLLSEHLQGEGARQGMLSSPHCEGGMMYLKFEVCERRCHTRSWYSSGTQKRSMR